MQVRVPSVPMQSGSRSLKPQRNLGLYYFMSCYLYILKSKSVEKYYTGISSNPEVRLSYHNTIEKGFTSRYRPWEIVFTKEYQSKEIAHQVELKIKSWKSKSMIERIIKGDLLV